ncbi:hypothetical protein ACFYW8_13600 [Streptomyces sp. NPDC002742]
MSTSPSCAVPLLRAAVQVVDAGPARLEVQVAGASFGSGCDW